LVFTWANKWGYVTPLSHDTKSKVTKITGIINRNETQTFL
jgi:hypothetical protein